MTAFRALLAVAALSIATVMHALEVECAPGALASAVGNNRDMTELTVSGRADASDLFFIADSLPSLTTLDISRLTIESYHGRKIKGSRFFQAASIPPGAFGGSGLHAIKLPEGISIGDMAFASSQLRELRLPQGCQIGDGAFADCRELTSVYFGAGTAVGEGSFRNCTALSSADLAGIAAIPAATFAGCTSLATVAGTSSIGKIGAEAFARTASLKNFTFPVGLASIGERAFAASGLEEALLPQSVTEIGREAFFGCPALRKAVLPAALTSVADYLFANTPLASLQLPAAMRSMGRFALRSTALVAVELPESLDEIGDGAMEDMTTLLTIDARALEAVPTTGAGVWAGVDGGNVTLYVSSEEAGFAEAPQWQDFNIIVKEKDSVNAPLAPEIPLLARLSEGGTLSLVSQQAEIRRVQVFRLSGEPVLDITPGATSCVADLSALPGGTIIVVAATLTDGQRSIFKFAL